MLHVLQFHEQLEWNRDWDKLTVACDYLPVSHSHHLLSHNVSSKHYQYNCRQTRHGIEPRTSRLQLKAYTLKMYNSFLKRHIHLQSFFDVTPSEILRPICLLGPSIKELKSNAFVRDEKSRLKHLQGILFIATLSTLTGRTSSWLQTAG